MFYNGNGKKIESKISLRRQSETHHQNENLMLVGFNSNGVIHENKMNYEPVKCFAENRPNYNVNKRQHHSSTNTVHFSIPIQ